jgi:hypothetical protein
MARPIQRNAFRAATDEADAAPGYASSGEGVWSRARARGEQTPRMAGGPSKARGNNHTKSQLIEITRGQLRKCEVDLTLAASPRERDKALSMIEIKRKFIETLEAENVS